MHSNVMKSDFQQNFVREYLPQEGYLQLAKPCWPDFAYERYLNSVL